tara:strand:+ start:4099 stop:4344 length:246 start_codon:yes stop_codon:yes gene_type:complete
LIAYINIERKLIMANHINGNADGSNGQNESYTIPGRGVVKRSQLVNEVKKNKHPNFHVIDVNGEEYVRANPNKKKIDNVDK